ncbi:MAG: TonB-dependent receptor [Bacteroidota bacterium]
MNKFLLAGCLCTMLSMGLQMQAQNGTLRGKVSDGTSGEALMGATVRLLQGTTIKGGAYSDVEGSFTIKAPAGEYQTIISYYGYIADTSEAITITGGEITVKEVLLFENLQAQKELTVEIVARKSQATDVTLYQMKRNSLNAVDGISNEIMQRTGDADVGAAMQRITGVTVEGGKYVYVRGLGDRYSKTTLNGAELPGLDPNRNSVQMDLFPANLIDNILVYKNFSPDLPGSFSGGLVDVRTKDFPAKFTLKFSAAASYNPQANLRDDFLMAEQSSTDWLGYDDGTRAVPAFISENTQGTIPNLSSDNEDKIALDRITKSFGTQFDPSQTTSGLNQNYQISIGNQYDLGGKPFGFIANFSYRNGFTAYTGTEARFKNTSDVASGNIANSLNTELALNGPLGQQEVLWGGLIKLSFKPSPNHKFSFNYMHNQSGTNTARTYTGGYPGQDADLILQTRAISYLERSMDVFQLEGKHLFGKLSVDWIASMTESAQDEPDLRYFSNEFRMDEGDTLYDIDQSGIYTAPARFYRTLAETNQDLKVNFELPFQQWSGKEAKVKFGGAYTSKVRDFNETRYVMSFGTKTQAYNGNPTEYFSNGNLGIVDTFIAPAPFDFTRYDMGLYYQDASEDRNDYTGDQTILAGYLMVELPLTNRLKVITGARYEGTDVTTVSNDSSIAPGVLDLNDILPAANFVAKLSEKMNLRAGYSRTLARPTFREFAPFASFDFDGDFLLVGNPELQRTLIDNADLRWEFYPSLTELVSVSLFYKNFTNPIERILDPRAQNPQYQFRNVDNGVAYGAEFEIKKNFGFVSDALRKLTLGANLALIQSRIDINELEYQNIIAVDDTRPRRRPMFGQSPYAVNAELAYIDKEDLGLQASLSFNMFGERIAIVGGSDPDIYEQPRGLMNFSLAKTFGMFSIRFRANNLLDPEYKMTQEYRPEINDPFVFRSYTLGRSYSLGISVSL